MIRIYLIGYMGLGKPQSARSWHSYSISGLLIWTVYREQVPQDCSRDFAERGEEEFRLIEQRH